VSVQLKFRNEFRRTLPHVNNIHRLFEQLKGTGSVCKRKSSEYLQLRRPGFNCSWYIYIFFSGVKSRTFCAPKKYEICAPWRTESAQLLKRHARYAFSCMRGTWIQSRHF